MATHDHDRFDSVPDDLLRRGAHRGPRRRGRGWIAFAWAALATGVLVVAGLLGLFVIRGTLTVPSFLSSQPSASASASAAPSVTPTVTPTVDPAAVITILNGTKTTSLAGNVGNYLVTKGWTGASANIGSRLDAATSTITQTTVYYSSATEEAAARGLLLSLKIGVLKLSNAYPNSPLTVVLGSDYRLPAS